MISERTALECPICQEDIRDMRMLPCIHSFCLKCLERYCRGKLPGDDVPCPVCRSEFQIPKNGVGNLPVRSHATELFSASKQGRERYCQRHEDERIKIYCFDCSANVCAMCCLEEHKTHKFERIQDVVAEFSKSIDNDVEQVTSRIECFRGVAAQKEAEHSKTLKNIEEMELEVKQRSENAVQKFRQLVEHQKDDVLHQLQSMKSAAEIGMKSNADTLQSALTEMEQLRRTSLEVRSKGLPADAAQTANDVHERAKELLKTYIIPAEYHAPSYTFTHVNIDELISGDQNFIGDVGDVGNSAARVTKKILTKHRVFGVTSVDDELFVLLRQDDNQDQVAVYSIRDYRLLRHLNVPGCAPSNITSCVRHRCLYMSEYDNRCIHRYDLRRDISAKIKRIGSSRISRWSVPGCPCGLSVTPDCNLLVTCRGDPDKLLEMSADSGQCVRKVALHADIKDPWHAVQLPTNQFVVCHGVGFDTLHRVCAVSDDGKVTRSYGGQPGSGVGQLNYPCSLAVDEDSQFVYAADERNDRVVLLSPTLEFKNYVIRNLSGIRDIYFDQSTRRLFVSQRGGDISVIQL